VPPIIKIMVPAILAPQVTSYGDTSVGVSSSSTPTAKPSVESLANAVNQDITSTTESASSLIPTAQLMIKLMEPA